MITASGPWVCLSCHTEFQARPLLAPRIALALFGAFLILLVPLMGVAESSSERIHNRVEADMALDAAKEGRSYQREPFQKSAAADAVWSVALLAAGILTIRYSLRRRHSLMCPECGNVEAVPAGTPRGRALLGPDEPAPESAPAPSRQPLAAQFPAETEAQWAARVAEDEAKAFRERTRSKP